ncbi:hypothetical protein LJ721_004727 [Salmonella enterica]|nr:hypothetical protein [Salmonella enterica]
MAIKGILSKGKATKATRNFFDDVCDQLNQDQTTDVTTNEVKPQTLLDKLLFRKPELTEQARRLQEILRAMEDPSLTDYQERRLLDVLRKHCRRYPETAEAYGLINDAPTNPVSQLKMPYPFNRGQ